MFPFIDFFGRRIGSYALCAIAGLFLSVFCVYRLGKRYNIAFEELILVILAAAGGMAAGGSLLYGLTNTKELILLFRSIGAITIGEFFSGLLSCFGGMVYYGGFLGGATAVWIYSRAAKNIPKEPIMDLYAVCVPLFHVFGRIGCFLGGCCYGIESSIGFLIEDNPLSPGFNGVRRFPVQLLEAGLNLMIFFVLLAVYRSGKFKQKLIYLYMLIYPPIRFLLEFLRGDTIRGFLFGLSTSQWVSVILLTFSLGIFIRDRIRSQKTT